MSEEKFLFKAHRKEWKEYEAGEWERKPIKGLYVTDKFLNGDVSHYIITSKKDEIEIDIETLELVSSPLHSEIQALKERVRELEGKTRAFILRHEPWEGDVDGEAVCNFAIDMGVGKIVPYDRSKHGDDIGDDVEIMKLPGFEDRYCFFQEGKMLTTKQGEPVTLTREQLDALNKGGNQ